MTQTAQLIIILLVVCLAIVSAGYVPLVIWILNQRKKTLENLAESEKETQDLVARAKQQAGGIVSGATNLAEGSREELKIKLEEVSRKRSAEFDEFTKGLMDDYRRAFQEGRDKDINSIHSVTESLASEASNYIKTIKETLDQASEASLAQIKAGTAAELEAAQKEIAEYKNSQREELSNRAWEAISRAAVEVFQKSLTSDEHKKIVLQALEKANYEPKS